ncbi:hypothetical protein ANN_14045 [Periplaneta americana]|uniref:Uncharacterized protein n=1 Tax=Periplaneta americana TaxID=6978 RepID=A0ABQ8SWK8_PERAM|nr:hypothetical protein ANN_14045 [Periplaneta americana]
MTFPDWYKKKTNRWRFYLQKLRLQLIKPNVEHRAATIIGLQTNIIMSMDAILKNKITKTTQNQQQPSGKGRCYTCSKQCSTKSEKLNKLAKTTIVCGKYNLYVCRKHSQKTNIRCECVNEVDESE